MEPPFIEDLSPEDVHIIVGGHFSLRVKYIADPPPDIKWFRDKKELRSGKTVRVCKGSGTGRSSERNNFMEA